VRAFKIIGIIMVILAVAAGGFYFGFRFREKAPETFRELSWRELYAGVLRTYINSESPDSGSAQFNIYDLDGDGTPELLVSKDNFHLAPAEVFALYRGTVYYLGGFGSSGDFQYDPVTGYIYSEYSNLGIASTSIRQIVDGKVNDIASFVEISDSPVAPGEQGFAVNGAEVSEEEYNREWEKYDHKTDDNFTVRKYVVNEDEIARVLGLSS